MEEVEKWETEKKTEVEGGLKESGPEPVYEEEERSGDDEWETKEDVDREMDPQEREELEREAKERGRTEQKGERDFERERSEWERRRAEIERMGEGDHGGGQPYPYPPEYLYLKVRAHRRCNVFINTIYVQFIDGKFSTYNICLVQKGHPGEDGGQGPKVNKDVLNPVAKSVNAHRTGVSFR